MLKKVIGFCVVSLFVVGTVAVSSFATDAAGPADITMVGKKKSANFPHKMHQDAISCAECHHSMADGKQVAFVEGQEVKKCADCHNKDVLAGKKMGKLKLDTIKGAGHGNCLACHKAMEKKDAALKAKKLSKCKTCHPKKKK